MKKMKVHRVDTAPVTSIEGVIGDLEVMYMEQLIKEITWEQHHDNRKEAMFKRYRGPYYYGYGRGIRSCFEQPEPAALIDMWQTVEEVTGTKFEVCFINYYLNGAGDIGWHFDDSPTIDQSRPVVVLSLGQERTAMYRPIFDHDRITALKCKGGSLTIMHPGMQGLFQHCIPVEAYALGERLSLVFRGVSE